MIAGVLLATITAIGFSPSLDGVAIGKNITAVIAAREIPVDRENPTVSNTDTGHVWTWTATDGTLERITTNDGGAVQMIDILASPANQRKISVPIVGSLQFNVDSHVNAQSAAGGADPALFTDEWLPLARRSGTVLGYVIEPDFGLLLAFPAPGDLGLIEVLCGTKRALSNTGMIPAGMPIIRPGRTNESDLGVAPVDHVFEAAKLTGIPAGNRFVRSPSTYAFLRISVGTNGIPSTATYFAGESAGSDVAIQVALREKFQPATLDGKPVPSVYFQRLPV
jgi:hypothetical protein